MTTRTWPIACLTVLLTASGCLEGASTDFRKGATENSNIKCTSELEGSPSGGTYTFTTTALDAPLSFGTETLVAAGHEFVGEGVVQKSDQDASPSFLLLSDIIGLPNNEEHRKNGSWEQQIVFVTDARKHSVRSALVVEWLKKSTLFNSSVDFLDRTPEQEAVVPSANPIPITVMTRRRLNKNIVQAAQYITDMLAKGDLSQDNNGRQPTAQAGQDQDQIVEWSDSTLRSSARRMGNTQGSEAPELTTTFSLDLGEGDNPGMVLSFFADRAGATQQLLETWRCIPESQGSYAMARTATTRVNLFMNYLLAGLGDGVLMNRGTGER